MYLYRVFLDSSTSMLVIISMVVALTALSLVTTFVYILHIRTKKHREKYKGKLYFLILRYTYAGYLFTLPTS